MLSHDDTSATTPSNTEICDSAADTFVYFKYKSVHACINALWISLTNTSYSVMIILSNNRRVLSSGDRL